MRWACAARSCNVAAISRPTRGSIGCSTSRAAAAPRRLRGQRREKAPFCGYADGLNPDNIGVALPAIAACVPEGQPYWIDMESGVRTDDRFDLDKCELVLMQVFDAG
jgi:hypothetical protein